MEVESVRDDELPKIVKILFWPVLTPSRSFEEISVRVTAILMALCGILMLYGSIKEQMEIYFR